MIPCVVMTPQEWDEIPDAVKGKDADGCWAWVADGSTRTPRRVSVWVHATAATALRDVDRVWPPMSSNFS